MMNLAAQSQKQEPKKKKEKDVKQAPTWYHGDKPFPKDKSQRIENNYKRRIMQFAIMSQKGKPSFVIDLEERTVSRQLENLIVPLERRNN